ncbi:uncharacterized protein K02A2.6-like [Anneissia japonica]|uniref:uncharacterized protein K02A2.6-like n=1 Tax=Anneissia japonica TaxID=1529436 RepID=UPI00142596AD|nr:uncharacterized protein K02A2.6-like [Anneissia japonica]
MSATSSEQTIEILRSVFARDGLPEKLVTDNGPQFIAHTFKRFIEANGIRHITSAPYHPRTNGLVERFVQTFKHSMRASRAQHSSLGKRLSTFLLSYRSTPQTTTQETPAKLFLGRELQTRLTLMKPNIARKVDVVNEKMEKVSNNVHKFTVEETVAVREYSGHNKIGFLVLTGPLSYTVQTSPGTEWPRHANQLRSANLRDQEILHETLIEKEHTPTMRKTMTDHEEKLNHLLDLIYRTLLYISYNVWTVKG